ncbi:MAG: sodium ion-translocating decarboxylase subunit beta [Bacilli bacterium]|nr:sodium ion-translocating decarboxylase subunit beta [Bacilli bacterium]
MAFWNTIVEFFKQSGIAGFFVSGGWKNLIMIVLALILLFLAIKKDFEPYLLLPIAFGMLLVNIPFAGQEVFKGGTAYNLAGFASVAGIQSGSADYTILTQIFESLGGVDGKYTVKAIYTTAFDFPGMTQTLKDAIINAYNSDCTGLLGWLYYGVKLGIYPCLIFLCIGATTDFGPLISNKKTMLLGAAAQIGIFITFIGAILLKFTPQEAGAIGIIGGADGPTAILVTTNLAPALLPSISIAAYSYMALVPVIQPPIIKLLTTKKERLIRMDANIKPVSKRERIMFPIIVSLVVILLVPSCAPLIGCLMLGNLIKESGVVPNITHTLSNGLLYTVTILLGLCVGATATAESFLTIQTIEIFALGIFAFAIATAGGVLGGKLMCVATKGKVNPMIGAAGVSAVPMAARVVHKMGQKEDPENFLLMHAMGPNVAGVIGSAVAAGVLLLLFK